MLGHIAYTLISQEELIRKNSVECRTSLRKGGNQTPQGRKSDSAREINEQKKGPSQGRHSVQFKSRVVGDVANLYVPMIARKWYVSTRAHQ